MTQMLAEGHLGCYRIGIGLTRESLGLDSNIKLE